jgi:hypothetical protein
VGLYLRRIRVVGGIKRMKRVGTFEVGRVLKTRRFARI